MPYIALRVLIAEINYGGRVTDDKDTRLIKALLSKYLTPEVMSEKPYHFSESGIYHSPAKLELDDIKDYIKTFPLEDDPEIFGLNSNANITFSQKVVNEFMGTLLEVSPRSGGSKASDNPDNIAMKIAIEIEKKMPTKYLDNDLPENAHSLEIFRF